MKIGIMGAGAIGGLIGGYLKKSNQDSYNSVIKKLNLSIRN